VETAYAIWRAFQDRFLARAAGLLLLGSTLLALLEVVRRYVLGLSYEWQQDAVTYFMLSGVFLYFSIAQRREAHLTVTLFVQVLENLGPRMRLVAEFIKIFTMIFSFVFMLVVVWWGVPEVLETQHYGSRSESLAYPMAPFLWVLLASFASMAVTLFFQIYREIQKMRGRIALIEPADADEIPH